VTLSHKLAVDEIHDLPELAVDEMDDTLDLDDDKPELDDMPEQLAVWTCPACAATITTASTAVEVAHRCPDRRSRWVRWEPQRGPFARPVEAASPSSAGDTTAPMTPTVAALVVELRRSGLTWWQVCAELVDRGMKPPKGTRWNPSTGRRVAGQVTP